MIRGNTTEVNIYRANQVAANASAPVSPRADPENPQQLEVVQATTVQMGTMPPVERPPNTEIWNGPLPADEEEKVPELQKKVSKKRTFHNEYKAAMKGNMTATSQKPLAGSKRS